MLNMESSCDLADWRWQLAEQVSRDKRILKLVSAAQPIKLYKANEWNVRDMN